MQAHLAPAMRHMRPVIAGLALTISAPAFAADPPPPPTAKSAAPATDAEPDTPEATASRVEAMVRELSDEVEGLKTELAAVRSELDDLRASPVVADPPGSPGPESRDAKQLARELRDRATGDRHSLYGDVRVGEGEIVNDAFTLAGDLEVAGTVIGDAVTLNGTITVLENGRVLGDAVSMQGDVIVEPGGLLAGEAHSLSGSVAVQPGGQVLGTAATIHHVEPSPALEGWFSAVLSWLYGRLVFLLAFAGAGVLVTALFQDRVSRVARALEERPGRAGLVGLGWTVGLIVVGLVTIVTIVGPLAALAVLGLAWLLGFVGLCQMLGDRLGLPLPYQTHGRWLAFLIGAVLVTFVGSLPWVGLFVILAASLFGMGAVFQTRFGAR